MQYTVQTNLQSRNFVETCQRKKKKKKLKKKVIKKKKIKKVGRGRLGRKKREVVIKIVTGERMRQQRIHYSCTISRIEFFFFNVVVVVGGMWFDGGGGGRGGGNALNRAICIFRQPTGESKRIAQEARSFQSAS